MVGFTEYREELLRQEVFTTSASRPVLHIAECSLPGMRAKKQFCRRNNFSTFSTATLKQSSFAYMAYCVLDYRFLLPVLRINLEQACNKTEISFAIDNEPIINMNDSVINLCQFEPLFDTAR